MNQPQKVRCAVFLALAIAADLLAFTIWAGRPARLHADVPGLVGDPRFAPVALVRAWLTEQTAPWTPTGLVSLFEPDDLVVGAALIVAPALCVLALGMMWRGTRPLPEVASAPRWLRLRRFRVRTALAAIAIVGLYLGWELNAWRSWRSVQYHRWKAGGYAEQERQSRSSLRQLQAQLAQFDAETAKWGLDTDTPEARAALRDSQRDFVQRELAYADAMLAFAARLKRKHEDAAAHPLRPVEPDPPPPQHDPWPRLRSVGGDAGVLDICAEEIRRYPALASAYQRRAWILATSPDRSLRDGDAAVVSATRACELTNGKDFRALAALAAAYAEAGQFALAIRWQQSALERLGTAEPESEFKQRVLEDEKKRLALYTQGKPFRHQHR